MEIECTSFGTDAFQRRFSNKDKETLSFYGGLSYDEDSIRKVIERPVHDHTEALAAIIREDMAGYGLSRSQEANLDRLAEGRRVVIGGQQAGLFMSPSYIMHKIITLLVLVREIREKYDYDAVPVFWVAGEDHDFDEVNHTFVYDQSHRRRMKVSYKPNLSVPMSLGFYKYDKASMKRTLSRILESCGDSGLLSERKERIIELIDTCEYWTELFHALVNDAFGDEGLLIFNAHGTSVRELERPMFRRMIDRHEEIDRAFRTGQEAFATALDTDPMIETETNVHLFTGSEENRTLLSHDAGTFHTDEGPKDREALLERLESNPTAFSNNVVTRPLMQEMLFNTLIFAGGGAEVKYWGELHKVFNTLGVPMPIVLKRMEIVHEDIRLSKLMDRYGLALSPSLPDDVENKKDELLSLNTDDAFLDRIDDIEGRLRSDYEGLMEAGRDHHTLIDANLKVHSKQFDYLRRRYQLEIRRQVRHQLNDLDEVAEKLLPGGALQERVYHPWMFPDTVPVTALSYTTALTIIKNV